MKACSYLLILTTAFACSKLWNVEYVINYDSGFFYGEIWRTKKKIKTVNAPSKKNNKTHLNMRACFLFACIDECLCLFSTMGS